MKLTFSLLYNFCRGAFLSLVLSQWTFVLLPGLMRLLQLFSLCMQHRRSGNLFRNAERKTMPVENDTPASSLSLFYVKRKQTHPSPFGSAEPSMLRTACLVLGSRAIRTE